jgi:flavin reductase (DIM6/NTAB) family NADH-FMN oxidoreductase RutF
MKVSAPISNDFCPQTLFLYGTYREDGTPNFGLFCWISYCFNGGLGVMADIGGEKLTKDRIKATGVFSANLVTEPMLPLADYFGNTKGYTADKMNVPVSVTRGAVLDVPILTDSPVSFELEVVKTVELDGSDVFLCKIRNVLLDEALTIKEKTPQQHLQSILPVSTTCNTYFSRSGEALGIWGEPMHAVMK